MYIIEIFRKRSKFEPVFKMIWDRISADMPYPPATEEEPEQKLVYFGMVAYAAVFEAAMVAGMSTSAAHYLARLQVGKYKLGKPIARAVEAVFSGVENEAEQAYADFYLSRMARMIEMVRAGEGDVAPVMLELAREFKPVSF